MNVLCIMYSRYARIHLYVLCILYGLCLFIETNESITFSLMLVSFHNVKLHTVTLYL